MHSTAPTHSENPAVGTLGLPLGTVVRVRATIAAADESKRMHDYRLRVTQVEGHALAGTPIMEFSVPSFISVELANDSFALYELKTGNKTGQLESAQIDEIEKGYVGRQVELVVYETGEYSGIPANLPEDVPMWQDHPFGFSTSLVVLAERK